MAKVGFIGLGNLGFPICQNLAQAGVDVVAHDARPRPERVDALEQLGARVVGRPVDAVQGRDVVITVLPNSDVVESVLLDREVLAALTPGTIWVEMSSGYPAATIRMGRALAERQVRLVDAPICNGAVPGAYARQIVLCVGGESDALEAVRPILSLVAAKVLPVGPLGSGHAVKIVNNSISLAVNAVVSEGLALGAAYGLDERQLVETLLQCSASKAQFEQAAKLYLSGPADGVSFQLELGTKDLRYSTTLAGELGSPHGVTDAAHAAFEIAERLLGGGTEASAGPGQLLRRLGSRSRGRSELLPAETR